MGALEQISNMKKQGLTEDQIIRSLQQQGISPKQINDAINQSQIKSAVTDEQNVEEFQPSIMEQESELAPPSPEGYGEETYEDQAYSPQTQEYSQGESPNQGYPQAYGQGYEASSQGYEQANYSDTMIEIAEQVFLEKIKKLQNQIEDLTEFKTLAETKIDYFENRLKRVENLLDKLQIEILEKIGSYGTNLSSIKKEMSMMQDSFGKMLPEIVKHHPKHTTKKKKTK